MTDAPQILRVIDFETTGMDATAEVIEVGYCDFNRTDLVVGTGDSYLCGAKAVPPETRAIHHIRHAELFWGDGTPLPQFDPEAVLQNALDTGVVGMAAHVAKFEAQWIGRTLEGVMPLICTWKASLRMWPDAPTHSNFGLLYWLEDAGLVQPIPERLLPSHRALPDAYATAHILQALFQAGATGKDLARWTREPPVYPTCPIGEHRDKPWAEVPLGFLNWMVGKVGLDPDHQWNAQQEIDRRKSL